MNNDSPHSMISAFRILETDMAATDDDIVRQTNHLIGAFPKREAEFREASDNLTVRRRDRWRHLLLEIPGAAYGSDPWPVVSRKFERLPAISPPPGPETAMPTLADFNWRTFLRLAIEERVSTATGDISPAVRLGPFSPGIGQPPITVYDVIFG